MAYSTWNSRPSGENVLTPRSYSLLRLNRVHQRKAPNITNSQSFPMMIKEAWLAHLVRNILFLQSQRRLPIPKSGWGKVYEVRSSGLRRLIADGSCSPLPIGGLLSYCHSTSLHFTYLLLPQADFHCCLTHGVGRM
jgi:hypothetical protein